MAEGERRRSAARARPGRTAGVRTAGVRTAGVRTAGVALAVVVAVVVVGGTVVASSGPVALWRAPTADLTPDVEDPGPRPTVAPDDRDTVPPPPPPAPRGPSWVGDVVRQVATLLLAATVAVVAVLLVRGLLRWLAARRLRRSVAVRRGGPGEVLDEVRLEVAVVLSDRIDGALLSAVPPRNAIVACWLQLEDDVAASGIPRHPAETSTEFSTRVVAERSVEPGPIGELAALFREARFSEHSLGEEHRARAVDALLRVRGALAAAGSVPAAAGATGAGGS